MKTIKMIIAFCFLSAQMLHAQIYSTKEGKVDFFSKTPLEDIDAHCKVAVILLNTKTNDIVVQIQNISFDFKNKLMQEHFNEKYMESETYPTSTFTGKINESIDYTKEGTHNVTVTGKLTIHGVTQERTIEGKVIVKGGVIQIISDFKVKVADHKIKIPDMVITKVAEEITVSVDTILKPKQ